MGKVDDYRQQLRSMDEWDAFLLQESGLPGPRGNIELARAVAAEGTPDLFERYAALDAETAPTNSPYEFLAFCGVLGWGRMLADGETGIWESLRLKASDIRWRTREAVAMALQYYGRQHMPALLDKMQTWAGGNLLEQRAAAAALCEPVLLTEPENTLRVLDILDTITASLLAVRAGDRKKDDFKALRKGLAYCWSVAVAAEPEMGKPKMEKWFASDDKDICWIMRENLKKKRLIRADQSWVEEWQGRYAR